MKYSILFFSALVAFSVSCTKGKPEFNGAEVTSQKLKFGIDTISRDFINPWGIAFLPDGRILVTERQGAIRIVQDGKLLADSVEGVPAVFAEGQGGLLDICLHPDFARNQTLYLSYSGGRGDEACTTVARAEWSETGLRNVAVIFEALPRTGGGLHFGSRIVLDRAGLMYVTCGERYQMRRAQDLGDLGGKVVRLKDDGSVPPDNPFVGKQGARPEIFTWGHRNPYSLNIDRVTGQFFEPRAQVGARLRGVLGQPLFFNQIEHRFGGRCRNRIRLALKRQVGCRRQCSSAHADCRSARPTPRVAPTS